MLFKLRLTLFFCTAILLFCLISFAEDDMPGSFKNPLAVQEVLSGKRKVANAAWWGFEPDDSTSALQSAINSGASKVIVPFMGDDWVVRPIKLASNQEIFFDTGVIVIAKKGEFKGKNSCLFSAIGKKNITLTGYGATLRMQKKDYITPEYVKSEWRMGIALYGCSNIQVDGLTIKDTGGDGIYVGANRGITCKDIKIKDCICDNNYRQGMSVTSAENLLVENCVFKNTNGTKPSAGIDLEPNSDKGNKLVNIVISNCVSENNAGFGFLIYLKNLSARSGVVSVLFVNCFVRNCSRGGIVVGAIKDDGPSGLIEFKNCTVKDMNSPGLYIYDKSANSANLRFDNCRWINVAKETTYLHDNPVSFPIYFFSRRNNFARKFGGVEFINCYVYDSKERPFLVTHDYIQDVYSIVGNINVYNPFGAKMDLGKKDDKVDLRVTNRQNR